MTKTYKPILVFLTVTYFFNQTYQSPPKQSLQNNDVSLDDSEFDTEYYQEIDYHKYQDIQNTIITRPRLVKAIHLEKAYPDLTPSVCGDGPCKTVMYELVNHNKTHQELKQVPTILLIAGMHGDEPLGVTALVQFVVLAQKLYLYQSKWFQLLNNARILVIPVVNMSGFERRAKEEVVTLGVEELHVDPKYDFNLSPKETCFTSFSAQAISKIYGDYLIYGSVLLTKGDFKLRYPKLERVMGTAYKDPDSELMVELVNNLTHVFNFHHDVQVLPESLSKDYDARFVGSNKPGTYIEWAFGASANLRHLNEGCFHKLSTFSKSYQRPSEYSHRALAFELQLNKGDVLSDEETVMGNEAYVVRSDHEESEPGIIPGVLIMLQRFVELMSPSVSLRKVEVDSSSLNMIQYSFTFELHGCHYLTSAEMVSNSLVTQKTIFNKIEYETTPVYNATIHGVFSNDSLKKNHITDFDFTFDCDSDFKLLLQRKEGLESHFFRGKFDSDYRVETQTSVFTPPQITNYRVLNVLKKDLEKGLVIEINKTDSELIYTREFLVQVGRFFPIVLSYERETNRLLTRLLPNRLPSQELRTEETQNYTIQQGLITNQQNSEFNAELRSMLVELRNDSRKLNLVFYNAFMGFLCNQIHTEGLLQNKLRLTSKINQIKQSIQSQDTNSHKLEALHKELKHLEHGLSINKCNQYYGETAIKNSESSTFFQVTSAKPVKVLPMMFYRLLGRSVNITLNKKDESKLLKDKPRQTQISGKVVLYDQTITGHSNESSAGKFIAPLQATKLETSLGQHFTYSTMMCSSLNPVIKVTSATLRRSEQIRSIYGSGSQSFNVNKDDFFTVHVKLDTRENSKGTLRVYTTMALEDDTLFLFQKNAKYELKQVDIKLDFPEEYDSDSLKVFGGDFDNEKLRLLGSYVMIYRPKGIYPVFDCFLGRDKHNYNVKTQFILYDSIKREVKAGAGGVLSKLEKDGVEESEDNGGYRILVWMLIGTLVLMGFGVFIGLVHFGVVDITIKDKSDLVDPLEKVDNVSVDKEKGNCN